MMADCGVVPGSVAGVTAAGLAPDIGVTGAAAIDGDATDGDATDGGATDCCVTDGAVTNGGATGAGTTGEGTTGEGKSARPAASSRTMAGWVTGEATATGVGRSSGVTADGIADRLGLAEPAGRVAGNGSSDEIAVEGAGTGVASGCIEAGVVI